MVLDMAETGVKICIWSFPRCGSTYLYNSLKQAYQPDLGLDEPLWNTKYESDQDIAERFNEITNQITNETTVVCKHHHRHETRIQKIKPNTYQWYDGLYNYNIFLYRKNLMYRSLSQCIMQGLGDWRNDRFIVDVEEFVSVYKGYLGDLLQSLVYRRKKFDEVVAYEDLPTDPVDMLHTLNIFNVHAPVTRNIKLLNPYRRTNYKQAITNWPELQDAVSEVTSLIPNLITSDYELNTQMIKLAFTNENTFLGIS